MAIRNKMPSLQSLLYFEAAARHASFTAAARELSTSQPAVSQHITRLENELSASLFERQHRGVLLTDDGQKLFATVTESLHNIRQELARIQGKNKVNQFIIETDMGFATYWLLPRIAALQHLMPDISVQITTSPDFFNSRDSTSDLAILFGSGHWDNCRAEKLFPELVIPVCSPGYLKQNRHIRTENGLQNSCLLSLPETQPARWLTWSDWFMAHGQSIPSPLRSMTFNAYSLVIQAALAGQGVALGWFPLVDDLIRSNALVPVARRKITTQRGYFLIERHSRPISALTETLKKWIFDESFLMQQMQYAY